MKLWQILLIVVLILAAAYIVFFLFFANTHTDDNVAVSNTNGGSMVVGTNQENTKNINTSDDVNTSASNANESGEDTEVVFNIQKKSAHFETSTPSHEDAVPAVPINIVIDVNFDLSSISTISITNNGIEYATGTTAVDANKLAMRRTMNPSAPDGKYQVQYNACWPDNSCHDGSFEFVIDRDGVEAFEDFRGQKSVTVTLQDVQIAPKNIRIDAGTTVTWVNDDQIDHYINTDSHPAHTYFPAQNSTALLTGDSFNVTFNSPGYYPYHCSAHPETMTGTIIVE